MQYQDLVLIIMGITTFSTSSRAAYFTLLAAYEHYKQENNFDRQDLIYLFVVALFHDYDPMKHFDKPHEDSVERFLRNDKSIKKFVSFKKIEKCDTMIFQSAKIRKFRRKYTLLCTMATNIAYLKASGSASTISTIEIFFHRISAVRSFLCFVNCCTSRHR